MELEKLARRVVRNIFSQSSRDRLKLIKYDVSAKMAPIYEFMHGSFSTEELEKEIHDKFPDDFDVLLAHSSHSGLLPMYKGNIKQLLDAIIRFCENGKTLVMPGFFYAMGQYHYDVIRYFQDNPTFDLHKIPAQTGLLTEMFRNYPGVKISRHPTHRLVALGPRAEEILEGHEHCQYSAGLNSPFHKMAEMRTLVAGIGNKYYNGCSQIHCPEFIAIEKKINPYEYEFPTVDVRVLDQEDEFQMKLVHPRCKKKHPWPSIKAVVTQWAFHGAPLYYSWASDINKCMLEGYHRLYEKTN
jgi:aminoglycoside N3'-acetyltransferase